MIDFLIWILIIVLMSMFCISIFESLKEVYYSIEKILLVIKIILNNKTLNLKIISEKLDKEYEYKSKNNNYYVASTYILKNNRDLSLNFLNSIRVNKITSWLFSLNRKDVLDLRNGLEDEKERKSNFVSKATMFNIILIPFFTTFLTYIIAYTNFGLSLISRGIILKEGNNNILEFLNKDDTTSELNQLVSNILDTVFYDTMKFHFELFLSIFILIMLYFIYRRFTLRRINKLYFAANTVYEYKQACFEAYEEQRKELIQCLVLNWSIKTENNGKSEIEVICISPDKNDCKVFLFKDVENVKKITGLLTEFKRNIQKRMK
ncbi:hypothetical protein AB1M41_13815 [Bacillus inaquosorum]|uniref:hypothetical protein n=1 Tax=Bacillus inaquosorum TaxID=483913 RepID=UPI0034CEA266